MYVHRVHVQIVLQAGFEFCPDSKTGRLTRPARESFAEDVGPIL